MHTSSDHLPGQTVAPNADTVFERPDSCDEATITVLRARTDLDFTVEDRAADELRAACRSTASTRWVLVFLGEERFVDVRGFTVLTDAAASADSVGVRIVLVFPPRCVRRLVEILGRPDSLDIADSAWEAAALVGRPPCERV